MNKTLWRLKALSRSMTSWQNRYLMVIQWLFNDYYLLIYSFRRYDIDIMKGFTQNLIKLHIFYILYIIWNKIHSLYYMQ